MFWILCTALSCELILIVLQLLRYTLVKLNLWMRHRCRQWWHLTPLEGNWAGFNGNYLLIRNVWLHFKICHLFFVCDFTRLQNALCATVVGAQRVWTMFNALLISFRFYSGFHSQYHKKHFFFGLADNANLTPCKIKLHRFPKCPLVVHYPWKEYSLPCSLCINSAIHTQKRCAHNLPFLLLISLKHKQSPSQKQTLSSTLCHTHRTHCIHAHTAYCPLSPV